MSRAASRCSTGTIALLVLAWAPGAHGQSAQERKRSEILDALGLKKAPPAAPLPPEAKDGAPAATGDAEQTEPARPAGAKAKGEGRPAAPTPGSVSFTRVVHPQLMTACKACHAPGGTGGLSRLLLTGDPVADHRAVVRFVDGKNPEASALLAKASGTTLHAGGALWPPTGTAYQRTLAWAKAGARLDAATAPAAVVTAPTRSATTAPPPRNTAAPVAPLPADGASAAVPPPTAAAVPAPPAGALAAPVAPHAAAPSPFVARVHPVLMATCASCHRRGGPAGTTRFVLSGMAADDETVTLAFADPDAPERSPLVTKSAGQMHAGGAILPSGDPRLDELLAWVRTLRPAEAPAANAPSVRRAAGPGEPTPPPPASLAARPPAPPPGPPAPGHASGVALPFGFRLNGRFGLDYERRQFSGNPFGDGSAQALRSYHHFLFLSRDAAGDLCGLSLEVVTLQFWEAHCRVPRLPDFLHLTITGGKLVVPFGAEPLYHQNYGGLGGFDQAVLPVVWAIEGAAARLVYERRDLVVTDDLFVVRGYGLARADAILNLQNGFSSDDATRLGFGNRIGLSWRFLSAWYSAYYNPLGFGRRLFMQAVDVTVWRPRGLPVLQHFSLGFGLLRADVSGGGPGVGGAGLDYYHFADYLQVRYHPTDWLYLQYRTGLRTFNNRRGLVVDNTRLTPADASAHNFAIVARRQGLTAGLYYFINLEKLDEAPNDLARLSVTYEF